VVKCLNVEIVIRYSIDGLIYFQINQIKLYLFDLTDNYSYELCKFKLYVQQDSKGSVNNTLNDTSSSK